MLNIISQNKITNGILQATIYITKIVRKPIIPSPDEEAEQLEPSYILVGMGNGTALWETRPAIPLKVKYTFCMTHSGYLPKRKESMWPNKNLYTKVYSGFIHNCFQKSTNCEWLSHLWYIHTMRYFSEARKNRLPTCTPKQKNHKCFCQMKKVRPY